MSSRQHVSVVNESRSTYVHVVLALLLQHRPLPRVFTYGGGKSKSLLKTILLPKDQLTSPTTSFNKYISYFTHGSSLMFTGMKTSLTELSVALLLQRLSDATIDTLTCPEAAGSPTGERVEGGRESALECLEVATHLVQAAFRRGKFALQLR